MTLRFFIFFISFISFQQASAQIAGQARAHTRNTNGWFMYFGNHKFSPKTGLHAEIQLRRHNVIDEAQQLLLRTGLDFYLRENNRLTIGYAFIKTYPYGEFSVPNPFPEHRIWQQFTTTQSLGALKLNHRYRLEQRFIGNATTGEFKGGRFENRFRYMAKFTHPLTRDWKRQLFVAVYDEIFINFGKEVGYNLFDQNRLYGALGTTLSANLKLEVGYLYQAVQLRGLDMIGPRNRIEDNHTLQLGLFATMPFYRSTGD